MKILHTSDWHLGMCYQHHSYIDDQKEFIRQISALVEEKNIDAVIIAGDIFDRSIPSAEAVRLYDEAMVELCVNRGTKVIIIAGNHDGADRLASCKDLLKGSGLYISGNLTAKPEVVQFDEADIYLLPWISTEWVRATYPEAEEIEDLEQAYKFVCEEFKKIFNPGKKNILASHAFITNAETSVSDRAAVVGAATQVGSFVYEGFDYVALGHIHKPQDVGSMARYSGTPMAYSFGSEETQEKSVTIIDTSDMSREIVPLMPLHKRFTLVGTYDEIFNKNYEKDVNDAYLKIELTDTYSSMDTFSRLREKFPNILELKGKSFEGDGSTITMTIDDLKAQENDPVSILKQYCANNGAELTDSVLELFKLAVEDYAKEEQR